jgi:dihydroorotate dehydrogenase (NAD+) catalytic subunit
MAARRTARPRAAHAGAAPARGARLELGVRIGPLTLANPVLTASGTYGYGEEYAHVQDPARLGAVITKTVTLESRVGNAPVRIAETAAGMLNSIGLENVGLERFVAEKLPKLRDSGATVIASIGGETPRELFRLLDRLAGEPGIAGFEVNFSCPNVARGGARYWAVPRRLERTLATLRPLTRRALIAKLSPDVTSVGDLARACEAGGADAVTAVNTFVGMSIDLDRRAPKLSRLTGGLSGPAIKPLALARCHEAARAVSIPVLGSGGIMTGRDAFEFIVAGAAAIQVGTVTFLRPRAALEVLGELEALLRRAGVRRLGDLRGSLDGTEAQPRRDAAPGTPRRTRRGAVAAGR